MNDRVFVRKGDHLKRRFSCIRYILGQCSTWTQLHFKICPERKNRRQFHLSFVICYFISLYRKFEFLDICVLNLSNKVQLICRYSDTKPNIYHDIVSIPPFPEIPYLCYFCHSSMDQGLLSAAHLSNQQTVSAHCSFFFLNLKSWKDPFHE